VAPTTVTHKHNVCVAIPLPHTALEESAANAKHGRVNEHASIHLLDAHCYNDIRLSGCTLHLRARFNWATTSELRKSDRRH
jgi:hypothetical protein